jgi:glucose/arabinose dehydrogenase
MSFSNSWMKKGLVLAAGTLCLAFAASTGAQVQTQTTTKAGQSSQVVKVERGEVVAVEGNDLIVRMEDGSLRHFENIPESAKVTVDGKQLGIHDLKPGMKLQRTITTTTTPQIVTTVETVTGKVWYVAPPLTVILTLENGTNQSFKIPKDQKFNVNGEMVDAFALRKGMVVTATKIVEVPVSVVSQERNVTGTMPTPPPNPPADAPLIIAEGEPTPVPADTETPATPANPVPAVGSHFLFIAVGLLVLLVLIVLLVAKFIRAKN